MRITAVKICGMERPMGYAFSHVTVSWRVEDSISQHQRESRVEIALDAQMHKIVSSRSGVLPCAGVPMELDLRPRTTYYVCVHVTGEAGDCASSPVTSFDTGKMQEPWRAKWIGPESGCPFHPLLSTTFRVEQRVRRARLYITGVGLYEARLNGSKVGQDVLAPFFNDYRFGVQVQTYDIGPLPEGENRLEILLGKGWYLGRLGYEGRSAVFGDRFAAIAELHLEYADGTQTTVLTDEHWTVQPSPVLSSDIYDGECWDYTTPPAEPTPVCLPDMSGTTLVDRYSIPLREMEDVAVQRVLHTPAGETVLDFGQNFAGYVSFCTERLTPGTRVKLEHGETLQQGNFYHDNYRTAKTEITYVSDGRTEWFRPHFTYMGFRYVKLTGWPGEPDPQDFVGKAVYSAMERTGWLETGHKKVNRLLENALWGLKSNFLDMPTDCPQRDERLGWTGDAQVFAPTASFFMDTRAFYRKFLWDMRCDQQRHGGAVSGYLPNFGDAPVGAAGWADAATFLPETVYDAFGDRPLLAECYPLMRDWVDWITRGDRARGEQNLFNFAFTFGDWLAMDGVTEQSMKGGTEDAYVASLCYYASTRKVARAAELLGYADDAAAYTALAEKIREAVLHEYFTPSGRLSVDTQTGYVLALRFGLWRDREKLIAGFRERLRRDAYRIRCGFMGAPLICQTLSECGLHDLAMHIFLGERFPSWLHCVNLGATTIWERWNSLLDDGSISGTGMNSLNHYAYGSVASFPVRCIAGLIPEEPGYRRVRFVPKPDARLGRMELTYVSASGIYRASWQILPEGGLHLHYEIPFDCQAVLVLPEGGERTLGPGVHDWVEQTQRDYRSLYGMDTMLEDVAGDSRAMALLETMLPVAWQMARSEDAENLSMTFRDLAQQPWFGCRSADVGRAVAELSRLRNP